MRPVCLHKGKIAWLVSKLFNWKANFTGVLVSVISKSSMKNTKYWNLYICTIANLSQKIALFLQLTYMAIWGEMTKMNYSTDNINARKKQDISFANFTRNLCCFFGSRNCLNVLRKSFIVQHLLLLWL